MRRTLSLFAVILLLASCASLQRSRDEADVSKISRLINTGQSQKLITMIAVPFLLDQEIIVLAKDVVTFWEGIIRAGYRIEEPELERGLPVSADSYREFFDSMEVKTFFKKYVKKGARLLELKTGGGRKILLLARDTGFSRKIYGFKGPF